MKGPAVKGGEQFARVTRSFFALPHRQFKVAAAILLHHNHNKPEECFPSIDLIAEITGVERRNVRRDVAELERKGVFRIDRTVGSNNRYIVLDPRVASTPGRYDPGVTATTPPGVGATNQPGVAATPLTDQVTDQVTDHLSPAEADDAVDVADAEKTGETNARSPIADVLPLGIETTRGGGASPRKKRPQSDKSAKPVREDKRTDAEKSADAAMLLLLARIEPYLHGMTVSQWRARNRRVVVDMVQAGMSIDEIDAAHDEIRDPDGKPFIVMHYFQQKLVTQALRPVPPAVVTGLDRMTDEQRDAITRKELARRAAAGETDSPTSDAAQRRNFRPQQRMVDTPIPEFDMSKPLR